MTNDQEFFTKLVEEANRGIDSLVTVLQIKKLPKGLYAYIGEDLDKLTDQLCIFIAQANKLFEGKHD